MGKLEELLRERQKLNLRYNDMWDIKLETDYTMAHWEGLEEYRTYMVEIFDKVNEFYRILELGIERLDFEISDLKERLIDEIQ